MEQEKKIILFGAGDMGKRSLGHFGADRVYCFADTHKAGSSYCDKLVISIEELAAIQDDYLIIVSTTFNVYMDIFPLLKEKGIRQFQCIQSITLKPFSVQTSIQKLKNRFLGKRCFLIGNGPSLSIGDLDTLTKRQEISFASNKIFRLFDQTEWYPDVYCISDPVQMKDCWEYLSFFPFPIMLLRDPASTLYQKECVPLIKGKNVHYFNPIFVDSLQEEYMSYSCQPDHHVIIRATVIEVMFQFALYMGIREMYLLGVDCNYQPVDTLSETNKNHFYVEPDPKKRNQYTPSGERMIEAFVKMECYAQEHGIKVYNATRGGKLEVFERVDFDCLF